MADGQPDWLHLVEVDHDPFAGAPVTLQEVDHDPFAQPPPMTAQQRYRASQYGDESRMPSFERTGPSVADIPATMYGSLRDLAQVRPSELAAAWQRGSDAYPAQLGSDPMSLAGLAQNYEKLPGLETAGGIGPSDLGMAGIIKAYHGSPHDFERFDLSKIGTGEGAQAYGHGLYFAENEGVARNYRDVLGRGPIDGTVAALVRRAGGDWEKARTEFMSAVGNEKPTPEIQKIIDGLAAGPPGHMYEVGIRARPEDFLDWDRPLREQGTQVRDAFKNLGIGGEFHPGSGAYDLAARQFGGAREAPKASGALREAGIPGIRYLDEGSRGTWSVQESPRGFYAKQGLGQGYGGKVSEYFPTRAEAQAWADRERTSNYVMFDDKLIDILRKYGIVGALGGAGAADFLNQPQPQQRGM